MSIPADFRRVLEAGDPDWSKGVSPRFYLLYGDHLKNTLHGYTVSEFQKVMAQISAMARGSKEKRILSRLIIGQSICIEVDKDGRTVMPIRQREKLGLEEGELKFSGLGEYFEIWKSEIYEQDVSGEVNEWLDQQGEDFDPLVMIKG